MRIEVSYRDRDFKPHSPVYGVTSALELLDRLLRMRTRDLCFIDFWLLLKVPRSSVERNPITCTIKRCLMTSADAGPPRMCEIVVERFGDPDYVEQIAVEVWGRTIDLAARHNRKYPPRYHA